MKKLSVTLGALIVATAAQAGEHKVRRVWESDATLKTPESVYFDAKRKVLYVSNIDGEPWAADGKGSIGKVGLDGQGDRHRMGHGPRLPEGHGAV
jgi:hypothetical protein